MKSLWKFLLCALLGLGLIQGLICWRLSDAWPPRCGVGYVPMDEAVELVADKTLVGKSRLEVIEFVGQPEKNPSPKWDLMYRLSMEPGFLSIKSKWLVFRLGKDGRVIETRIVQD